MTRWRHFAILLIVAALLFTASALALAQDPAPADSSWLAYKIPYAGEENDIQNPNRTSDEITNWSQQATAEILSFSPADYQTRLNDFKKYFLPQAWQAYADALRSSKLINRVTEEGYSIRAIVDRPPEIVSHDAVGGAYHWIVKLPVTISILIPDREGNNRNSAAERYTVFMDMARVAQGGNDGIAIQHWQMNEVTPAP
ncbi:MAG: DotI/IcmL family type IV secretion protein [Proteobacteria bacterium]|nr:DotI/IcmL family type IV secretion protein [Pseudomonadota bacterium]